MVKLDTSAGAEPGSFELCELFPTGKNQDCSVTLTADNRFALGKDDQTTFVDLSGTTALESLTWSGTPKSIANDPPYLISTLSDFVEIRTETPKMVIQTIDLQKGYIEFTLRIFMPQINLVFFFNILFILFFENCFFNGICEFPPINDKIETKILIYKIRIFYLQN